MNTRPSPFGRITITKRLAAPVTRAGRTKYRMACKRTTAGSSLKKSGFHTLQEARLLIAAWQANGNATSDVTVEFIDDAEVILLQTDADWAIALLKFGP